MSSQPASALKQEVRAIQIAIACSVVGAITKFIFGFITGSMSMISSAVDSLGDLFVSVANLVVVRVSGSAPDEEHNYGHAKIEGLGAMFEGGFIFAAGSFIIYEAGHKILVGEESHDSVLGILVMLPILAMTVATVLHLRKVARATGSLVIKSDALHYTTDVYVNLGVLLSLILVKLTGRPIIDSIISIAIALYMLWSSTKIVREGFDVVMDRSLDREQSRKIQALLGSSPRIQSFHDFRTRAGRIAHVDVHIVVAPEMTARELHDLFLELQEGVRGILGQETRMMIHADPAE